ncbi:CheR family methyltransferase [Litorivicinus lipolyticus]|nr:protein-glutamate O-methyltransferase CheR [Litorivicinus lipolyticus]
MNQAVSAFGAEANKREFLMTQSDFNRIVRIAHESTGIVLSDHKKEMVYSRLARRIRRCQLGSFSQYLELIGKDPEETNEFVNALTTNLTSFFRENHHFEHMLATSLPDLLKRNGGSRRLRVWSCAASTGEEPYSIAMMLREFGFDRSWDIKLLATDLDSAVLNTARAGLYNEDRVNGMNPEWRDKYLTRQGDGHWSVNDDVRRLVSFKRLNVLEKWPMKGQFDIVFCRNIVIYFDKDTQRVLFDRIANQMAPEAWLYIGHSETLHRVTERYQGHGQTIYRKIK